MHTDRGAHGLSKLETARSHSKTKPGVRVSELRRETRTEPETRQECRNSNTMFQHEKEHKDKRALTRKQDKKKVSGVCHKTINKLDRSDRTLTLIPIPPPQKGSIWHSGMEGWEGGREGGREAKPDPVKKPRKSLGWSRVEREG